jgi:hypothetical protein
MMSGQPHLECFAAAQNRNKFHTVAVSIRPRHGLTFDPGRRSSIKSSSKDYNLVVVFFRKENQG